MQEEKKNKKKTIKLIGDGSPHLLTTDTFYKLAKEKEKEMQEEERLKGEQKEARVLYKKVVVAWKVADEKQKKDAADVRAKNKKAVEAFNKKKDAVRKAGKKFTLTTPLPAPKAISKLKLKDFLGTADAVDAKEDYGEDGKDFGPSVGESDEGDDNDN